ncbi:MAG: undecaprenyl-diphosphate phosphatase [Ruminococcaceae bacterium]|nr:undecaprenyl-diphosphate phosphatase [Oscillospiraceae bacterium]
MNIFSAIFYGIIQGITEFLPVSSSAHLAIAQNIFGMGNVEADHFTFDILLHLGTLIAVFIVYYKDIFSLVPAAFSMLGKVFKGKFKLSEYNENERFVIFVIVATLPLVLAVFIKDYIELLGNYTKIIGGILILNGLVLFISDKLERGTVSLENTKPKNALFVGLCQMCAIVPGLSRSGSTITGGLLMGFKREYAVKFSFILSIPAIIGANLLSFADVFENPIARTDVIPYIAGTIAAAVVGILAMKLLIYISRKSNFRMFSYYCFAVGILAIIFG